MKITLFKSEIIVTAGDTRLFVRFIFKPLYNGEKKKVEHASKHTLTRASVHPRMYKTKYFRLRRFYEVNKYAEREKMI